MKIIHLLLGKANPNSMNGVNKVVHHIATRQFRAGHDVEVWGITATPQKIRHQHEYPLRLFKSVKVRFFLFNTLKRALNSLQSNDIVHMHSVFLPELYSASRILRRNGVPWVVTSHGGYARESMKKNWFAKRVYVALFETRFLSQAAVLHTIGASEVGDIKRLCQPQKIVLIPNGQDLEEVVYTPKPLPAVEGPIFGFCGRLAEKHKGLDLLIGGFASYKKQGGRGRLWLIGDGEDKTKLENQTKRLMVSETVEFLGPKFGDEKLNLIAHMDVFVHTSRWEGLPMACLEAAALSRPLLISKKTDLGEYVARHKAGVVLFENTPARIAQAMQSFEKDVGSGRASALGQNAQSMIEAEFDWALIALKLVEAYWK
jgi:glycosyltransferase involved in cell wall biosynthesis